MKKVILVLVCVMVLIALVSYLRTPDGEFVDTPRVGSFLHIMSNNEYSLPTDWVEKIRIPTQNIDLPEDGIVLDLISFVNDWILAPLRLLIRGFVFFANTILVIFNYVYLIFTY